MIGKNQIEFGWQDFVAGATTSNETADGGFTPSSQHINTVVYPGLVYSSPNGTNQSTNLTDTLIASCEYESNTTPTYDHLYVDDTGGYYRQSGQTITKDYSGAQTSRYTTGITDMVAYDTDAFVTLTNDVSKYAPNSSLDEDWWTNTMAQAALGTSRWHPMLVFQQLLWIADGNKLHTFDAATVTATADVLELGEFEKIIALGIDPGTGLMMISTTNAFDSSDITQRTNAIYLYDGFSSKPRKKTLVDDMVTFIYPVGGVVYMGYGLCIGAWNGSGITFMRRLTRSTQLPPYKHVVSNYQNILLVRDGNEVWAYGEIVPGKKGWFPFLKNRSSDTSSTADYALVAHTGEGNVTVSFSSSKAYQYSIDTQSAGTGTLVVRKIDFPRPCFVRMIRILTTAVTTTSGIGTVGFYDETGTLRSPEKATFGVSGSTTYVHDFIYGGFKSMSAQPSITFASQAFGVERIIVYYDVAE